MDNQTAIQNKSEDIISLAIEKIKGEFDGFSGENKETAISSYVSRILQDFCKQDKRFAEVVYKFKRTLSDCCAEIMHGVKSHISDIDVYRGAVKFYFPNAEVSMNMSIEITGEAPSEDVILKEAEKPKEKTVSRKKAENKPQKTARKAATEKKPVARAKKKETSDSSNVIQLSLF